MIFTWNFMFFIIGFLICNTNNNELECKYFCIISGILFTIFINMYLTIIFGIIKCIEKKYIIYHIYGFFTAFSISYTFSIHNCIIYPITFLLILCLYPNCYYIGKSSFYN